MSSSKNMFTSLRNSTAAKSAPPAQVAPPTPPAFKRRSDFGPPPLRADFQPPPPRRVPSTGSSAASVRSASPPPAVPAVPSAAPAPAPMLPRRQTATPPEESGEWVEAMYDYSSEDPGDLDIQEGQRILVVERTSDDW